MKPVKQQNIFQPAWPTIYHDLIKKVIEGSSDEKQLFKSIIIDGTEISTETIFEKLRLSSDGFMKISNNEREKGDQNLTADFYFELCQAFIKLSNDCIFRLNGMTAVKINELIDTVLEKLKSELN